ncbi:MAG: hypothetical protein JXR46_00475 [Calditrichaceae bacterium]|nr:hypothetical protein [Calditrichaceae bacterium]MBN2707488.1 hypothetical protein [Calditrichaceae bacterium]RQV95579.1 MAG: hypothetical protein EH224_06880 [Calditrichota bacterium]
MKKFIIKSFLLFIIPCVIYVATFYVLKDSFKRQLSKYSIILLGDSQTKFIKNSEIYNHSIDGSPYFVHYIFASEFIEYLKGKKIYISCNYHNFSKLYQNRLANDSLLPGWREYVFRHIDKYDIFNYKHSELRPVDLDYTLFDIKKLPDLFRDIYVKRKNSNSMVNIVYDTLSIKNEIKRHWYDPRYMLKDTIQRKYLNKLVTLLKENKCEVILLKMPLTNFYIKNVPLQIKNEFPLLSNKYSIQILDLNNALSISNQYIYFKDYGHLNSLGDSLVIDYFIKNEIKSQTYKSIYEQ